MRTKSTSQPIINGAVSTADQNFVVGAKPLLEGDPDPVPEAPAQPSSSTSSMPEGDDDAKPAAPKRKTPATAPAAVSGCTVTTEPHATDVSPAIVALLAAASAFSRRARSSRDR